MHCWPAAQHAPAGWEKVQMEDKTVKKILAVAVQRETDSQRLYTHIASQVINTAAKAKFEALAAEEANHEKIVRGMYEKRFGKLDLKPAPTDLPAISREKTESSKEVLEFAVEREKESQAFYKGLAEKIDDREARDLCGKMVEEERKHQQLLENELRVLTKEFYWYSIYAPPWQVKDEL
jgi:rubrerythrin